MITLFFCLEGHMSYSLTPCTFLPSWLRGLYSWPGFSFSTFTLEWCWSPDPSLSMNSCILFLILLPHHAFENPACPSWNWWLKLHTIQLCLFHVLVKLCSKSFKLGFSSIWTNNVQMYKLGWENAEEPEIKLPTFDESWRKQRCSRKTSTSASLTILKPLTVWITRSCGKFLNRWKYQATLPVSWEYCMQVKK